MRYAIYIPSKGRWQFGRRLTSRALDKIGVPYHIVVEPQEYSEYAKVIHPTKILTLPSPNYGQGCSVPARNWIWEHSVESGAKRHWVLDDNIQRFERLNENKKTEVADDSVFTFAEDFVDQYQNLALASMAYRFHAPAHLAMPPYYLNRSRVQSCVLVQNDLPFRWEGRFNEDVDLALRVLKSGRCTVVFNAFLIDKPKSRRKRGGNTDGVYADDPDLRKKAESLVRKHPDVAKAVWLKAAGHGHHRVDHTPFATQLRMVASALGAQTA